MTRGRRLILGAALLAEHVVRRGAEELGGRVGVATSPGRATRFRVLLPAELARRDAVA